MRGAMQVVSLDNAIGLGGEIPGNSTRSNRSLNLHSDGEPFCQTGGLQSYWRLCLSNADAPGRASMKLSQRPFFQIPKLLAVLCDELPAVGAFDESHRGAGGELLHHSSAAVHRYERLGLGSTRTCSISH